MDSSALKREVLIPPPRESAAAVVIISAMALLGVLATAALAVRVKQNRARLLGCAAISDVSSARGEAEFMRLAHAGEDDVALAAWLALPPMGRVRTAPHRELVARRLKAFELGLLAMDIDRGNCPAIAERLSRLQTLLPDHELPVGMAFCEP